MNNTFRMKISKGNIGFALIICLTLGLAPFNPQPHIIGKLKWVAGGAISMKPIDYFDLVLHGLPWVYLLTLLILFSIRFVKNQKKGLD